MELLLPPAVSLPLVAQLIKTKYAIKLGRDVDEF